jgi:hypothetical protein
MGINSMSNKVIFRASFIALLIYHKKYKMVANFINRIGKENINEIKSILDSSIISPEYQNNSIPLNMLLNFVNDKDIYENTKFKSRLINGIYCGLSFICIAGIVYLFPVKNVENLSKLANILMPVITAVGLGGLFTQLPSLLRNSNPYLFLDKEISDFSKHILPSESGQMTIYRDLLNNLNKILDKEEGTPSVQNWLLDNSFEKKAQDLKVMEEHMQRARGLLDNTARGLKHGTIKQSWKIIEKDFKFFSTLSGYVLVKRSSQKDRSKHKPELLYNVLHSLKNVYIADYYKELELAPVKAFYEVMLKRMVEECEQRNLYTELFKIAFESYSSENIYLFSIFQEITSKKGLTIEIIFQRMKEKHLETSIKILGYLLNKVDVFLQKVKTNKDEQADELEVRINILKASIPEAITNRAIELWNEEIV